MPEATKILSARRWRNAINVMKVADRPISAIGGSGERGSVTRMLVTGGVGGVGG